MKFHILWIVKNVNYVIENKVVLILATYGTINFIIPQIFRIKHIFKIFDILPQKGNKIKFRQRFGICYYNKTQFCCLELSELEKNQNGFSFLKWKKAYLSLFTHNVMQICRRRG